jgi:hypothetical protein
VLKPVNLLGGHRIKTHANARLSLKDRELLIDRVENPTRKCGLAAAMKAATVCWIAAQHPVWSLTAPRSDGSR